MTPQTNMPWAVYKCAKLKLGQMPSDEVFVSGHLTASEAMAEANRLKAADRRHSYLVGSA